MGREKQSVLPLKYAVRDLYEREGRHVLRVIAEVVKAEIKQADGLAEDLGIAAPQLSAALHGAGKHFAVTWLPALLHQDREHKILRHLAALVGCEVRQRRELTAEEKVERLERELRNSGAAGDAILRRALGEEA